MKYIDSFKYKLTLKGFYIINEIRIFLNKDIQLLIKYLIISFLAPFIYKSKKLKKIIIENK